MGRRWWDGPVHQFRYEGPRPGPAHHFFKRLGPARAGPQHGSEAHEARALHEPACGFDRPAHGPAHVLFRTKTCMNTLR